MPSLIGTKTFGFFTRWLFGQINVIVVPYFRDRLYLGFFLSIDSSLHSLHRWACKALQSCVTLSQHCPSGFPPSGLFLFLTGCQNYLRISLDSISPSARALPFVWAVSLWFQTTPSYALPPLYSPHTSCSSRACRADPSGLGNFISHLHGNWHL